VLALGSYDMTTVNQFLRSVAPAAHGLALVVVKDGAIIEHAGYGRFGPGTVVDVGSSSRWLAAAAMMTLVDEGLLHLDDPVSMYLPEFTGPKAAITIRQLWSYSSGLLATDPSLTDRAITLEECVKRIAERPLVDEPGTVVTDGFASIQVGARVCEVISGTTWQEFFRTHLAEPLGMTSTSFNLMGFNRNPFVAGGARSTADDYARFLAMLLQDGLWQGRRLLSAEAVAELERDQTADATVASTPYTTTATLLPSTSGARPGLGMWREQTDTGTGKLLIAACPGTYGFTPWIDTSLHLAGVLSMKSDLGTQAYTIMRVRQLVPEAIAAGRRFKDVPATSWAFAAVADLSARGLVTGEADGLFHPEQPLTRAAFAALLCTSLGVQSPAPASDPFRDVPAGHWAAGSIAAAVSNGWLSGYPGGTFRPDDPVSMAQALAVIARSQAWQDTAVTPYADVPSSSWFAPAVAACFARGIIRSPDPGIETNGRLHPEAPCTRAQACVLLSRLLSLAR
jgi:CubicO group peptidase (beta-lactamase class C family)